MTNFKDFLEEQLKDDEIRKEYEKLEQEMDEYKGKDNNKEYVCTPYGKSYNSVLLLDKGFSTISPYDNELACGHSNTNILLFDSGVVERKCPICNRHEIYSSLADAFVEINKTIDRRNTMRILQNAIYVEKEIK